MGRDPMDSAASHWDRAHGGSRRGLGETLLTLSDAGHLLAEVSGTPPNRVVTGILGVPDSTSHPGIGGSRQSDSRAVFVVYGRNEELRSSLFTLLRAFDLRPIEWSTLTQLSDSASPYVGELLELGLQIAQAIVVLFTPDEFVALSPALGGTPEDEGHQPRPNVLFEAGLALGHNPDRTVIVEVGRLRGISDLQGRHSVRLDDSSPDGVARRQDLAGRLRRAGCEIDLSGTDWHSAGDFRF